MLSSFVIPQLFAATWSCKDLFPKSHPRGNWHIKEIMQNIDFKVL